MRVHPLPAVAGGRKNLRRLPHIFSKVLELPLAADAHVAVHDSPDALRFVAAAAAAPVRARAVRLHAGVVKVVVRPDGGEWDDFELDRWRFRLPPSTRPALATVEVGGGELVVVVPKGAGFEEEDGGDWGEDGAVEIRSGRMIAVQ